MKDYKSAINKWDIVVLPFPYIETNAQKRRPALVISNDAFNQKTGLLWVMMITTSPADWEHDVDITNPAPTNLPSPSKIRCAKLATIEANRVVRVAGKLGRTDLETVKKMLDKIK